MWESRQETTLATEKETQLVTEAAKITGQCCVTTVADRHSLFPSPRRKECLCYPLLKANSKHIQGTSMHFFPQKKTTLVV